MRKTKSGWFLMRLMPSSAVTSSRVSPFTCVDGAILTPPEPKGASAAKFKEWLDLYTATGKYKSKYGGDLSVRALFQCSVWKSDSVEKPRRRFGGIKTENPILFVNTVYDPVTPYESATNSSLGFTNSRVVKSLGVGVSFAHRIYIYND